MISSKLSNRIRLIWENSFWRKLAKNVFTVIVGNGGTAVLNFLLTVLMVRTLKNTDYGIFLIALQYMNIMDGIINFQSWAGVIKYGSEAVVNNNEERLCSIIKSGFIIDVYTSILGMVVAILIVPFVAQIMGWNDEIVLLAIIFSFEIVFHIEGTSVGVLRLFDKFRLTAIQAVTSSLIKLIAIGSYLLLGGNSLLVTTIIYVCSDIIKHLILFVMAAKVLQSTIGLKQILFSKIDKSVSRPFLFYTLWNGITYTTDVPVKYFDVFIISLISIDMVSIYKVFQQIFLILSMITIPISAAVLPQFSELIARGKLSEAYKKMLKIKNVILVTAIPVVVGSLFFAKPILTVFFGVEYGEQLLLFVILLTINLYFTSYVCVHPLMQGIGKAKINLLITLIGNIAYCLVAYFTVNELGVYSVVIARLIAGIIVIYPKRIYIGKQVTACKRPAM